MEVHKIIINLRVAAYEQPNVVGERFLADDSLLFPTYLPQADSLLERSGQTDRFLHPLFPKFFFSLSARGPTRRRNSTGLAELWGGWPIEQGVGVWCGVASAGSDNLITSTLNSLHVLKKKYKQ